MHNSLKIKGLIYKHFDKEHKHNFLQEQLASYNNNNNYNFKCFFEICLILLIILIICNSLQFYKIFKLYFTLQFCICEFHNKNLQKTFGIFK